MVIEPPALSSAARAMVRRAFCYATMLNARFHVENRRPAPLTR